MLDKSKINNKGKLYFCKTIEFLLCFFLSFYPNFYVELYSESSFFKYFFEQQLKSRIF